MTAHQARECVRAVPCQALRLPDPPKFGSFNHVTNQLALLRHHGHVWNIDAARGLASEHLSDLGDRWAHVQAVGSLAEALIVSHHVDEVVASAAWLHDVGYAPTVNRTGFHPVDGATFLLDANAPAELVGLVAHHTGAAYEAEERGLVDALAALPRPSSSNLDLLTFVDLLVGPDGTLTTPDERITEILSRYEIGHPVNRAVTRSQPELLASAERARQRLGLPDEWPVHTA